MTKIFFLFLAFGLLCACARQPEGARIANAPAADDTPAVINGQVVDHAKDARAGTLVAIEISLKGGTGHCTGTVVAPRVILTAAHCLEKALDVVVRFAASPVTGWVANWRSHPKYLGAFKDRKSTHDLALIRLKSSVPGAVKIARLANVGHALRNGQSVASYGYGFSSIVADQRPIATAQIRKRNNKKLNRGDFTVVETRESVFVTHTQGSALCQGDSGGPTFLTNTQRPTVIGVNSFGTDNRCIDSRNGVADVRVARDWIDHIMHRWSAPSR